MFSKISSSFNGFRKTTKPPTRRVDARLSATYQKLEPRRVLAGIFLDAATSTLTISGDATDDLGRFELLNPTTHRATLRGFGTMDFAVGTVQEVVFIGFNGDDFFANVTGINSRLLGGNGADTLRGGGGEDTIVGGAGNDLLVGGSNNDRIVGGNGDDNILGGDGDDRIFAGDGTNVARGGNGDDLIFGGTGVDRLHGDDGIDSIFGLAGDDILTSGAGGIAGTPGSDQADLILGHDGNDRITGGAGLNIFFAGNGDDLLFGGSGENRLHGQLGNDQITGGEGDDFLAGQAGDDVIFGLGGDDFILPSHGNDIVGGGAGDDFIRVLTGDDFIDGGADNDTIEYRFNFNTYTVDGLGANLTFDNVNDGTDTVNNFETVRFGDRVRSVTPQRTRVVVQPIIVSNTNGSNTAEFFGTASQQAEIIQDIDSIYSVANVDVDFLPANRYSNTFANIGNGGVRPGLDLFTIVNNGDAAGVGSPDPLVLDLYFVEVSAGFGETSDFTANGVAFVGANGSSIHIGDFLPGLALGRDIVAEVTAHEIAHNLGLGHSTDPNNLQASGGSGRQLTQAQIWTIEDSAFSVPVGGNPATGSAAVPATVATEIDDHSVSL